MKIVKALLMVGTAAALMGNEGCPQKQTVEERQLRRRVEMGSIAAARPEMPLPEAAGGGTFNFEFASNAQLQKVLRDGKTFSTVGSFIDQSKISDADKKEYYSCESKNPVRAFEFSQEAICMVNQPRAKIYGRITDFRVTKGANINLGFLDFGALTGAKYKFDQAVMKMDFIAYDPLQRGQEGTGVILAASEGKSYFKSHQGGVELDFGLIKLGLGGYLSTDMAKVVAEAMGDGLKDLKSQWDSQDKDWGLAGGWNAMVVKNCDLGILIGAGNAADAGLKKDDIVAIHNVDYQWSGAACQSQLNWSIAEEEPIAYARITSVAETVSRATLIEDDPNYPHRSGKVVPGARVYIKKFAPEAQAQVTKK